MKITFITGNKGKFEEVSLILSDWEIEHADIDLVEIQGTREEIIRAKAIAASEILQRPLIVEDVSLCCGALNGMPGPYAKDFLKAITAEGLSELVRKYDDHSIESICMAAYVEPGEEPQIFEGKISGRVVPPAGKNKHGPYSFNPIFLPDGHSKTMGEMTMEEHAEVSHRRRAFLKLRAHLEMSGVR